MQKQKNTRAFGQRKKKRKKTIFRPRRERKKNDFSSGHRKKKRFFSTFPVFRGEKVCRKKCNTCVRAEKEKKTIFLFFPALSAKGVHRTKTTLLIQHSIIVIQICWQLRMDFMSSACQVAIEHGETSATNILLKSVEFIFLIVIMMNLS